MTRRCSHCGYNGHNSRTCSDRCPDRGVRLFGVRLTVDGAMRKSLSMGNLTHYANASNLPSTSEHSESGAAAEGYVSDGLVQTSSNARERKKGVPWTEDEHRLFLLGLQKLGKGDWRGISRNFVQTRTPTQVASHAQKYFIRQSNLNKRKRRSSLFDIVTETGSKPMLEDVSSKSLEITGPIHQLSLGSTSMFGTGPYFEPGVQQMNRGEMFAHVPQMHGISVRAFPLGTHQQPPMSVPVMSLGGSSVAGQRGDATSASYISESPMSLLQRPVPVTSANNSATCGSGMQGPVGMSNLAGGHLQFPFSIWPGLAAPVYARPIPSFPSTNSKVHRPTPTFATVAKLDESTDIARLSLGTNPHSVEASSLSLKLLDQPSRHSAFHVKSPFNNSNMGPSGNAISVV